MFLSFIFYYLQLLLNYIWVWHGMTEQSAAITLIIAVDHDPALLAIEWVAIQL